MSDSSIVVTGTAQKLAWTTRALPPVEAIADGVWSVPVPCSDFSIRYTLAYLISSADGGFVIIDPGWNAAESRAALRAGIARAGFSIDQLSGVVVTHHHPDHVALADIARPRAWVGMHVLEARYMRERPGPEDWMDGERRWLLDLGVPPAALPTVQSTAEELTSHHVQIPVDLDLDNDDVLPIPGRGIRVIWTPGHTAGHICLVVEGAGLLLTGDHLLPRISPNVGAHWFDGRRDSVGQYLTSLDALVEWEGLEVCPAHEYRFRGVRPRVEQLRRHQEERSAEVARALDAHPGATPWQIASRLHWSRSWQSLDPLNRRAALGETVAQMIHLGAHVAAAAR